MEQSYSIRVISQYLKLYCKQFWNKNNGNSQIWRNLAKIKYCYCLSIKFMDIISIREIQI